MTDKVIHLSRVPTGVCPGRDKYDDEVYQEAQRMARTLQSGVVETTDGITDFSGNATCPTCKRWLRASKSRRERMANRGRQS